MFDDEPTVHKRVTREQIEKMLADAETVPLSERARAYWCDPFGASPSRLELVVFGIVCAAPTAAMFYALGRCL